MTAERCQRGTSMISKGRRLCFILVSLGIPGCMYFLILLIRRGGDGWFRDARRPVRILTRILMADHYCARLIPARNDQIPRHTQESPRRG